MFVPRFWNLLISMVVCGLWFVERGFAGRSMGVTMVGGFEVERGTDPKQIVEGLGVLIGSLKGREWG